MRFVLQSGRRVAVHVTRTPVTLPCAEAAPDREERIVVFCHSAPGAGLFDPQPEESRATNVRLLSVDRPGYGRSDPVFPGQWATVGSAADDIAAVVDTLDVEHVGVVGWSAGSLGSPAESTFGGGPSAPDRLVSGPGPRGIAQRRWRPDTPCRQR